MCDLEGERGEANWGLGCYSLAWRHAPAARAAGRWKSGAAPLSIAPRFMNVRLHQTMQHFSSKEMERRDRPERDFDLVGADCSPRATAAAPRSSAPRTSDGCCFYCRWISPVVVLREHCLALSACRRHDPRCLPLPRLRHAAEALRVGSNRLQRSCCCLSVSAHAK